LLVRLTDDSGTLADVAGLLAAPVLVVATAGLGVLNSAALTAEALAARALTCAGLVIGVWPTEPDLASRCNLDDLPAVTGAPLLGAVPDGAGALDPAAFATVARHSLAPPLGGGWHTPDP
jgi:dethiobiotin synthetase